MMKHLQRAATADSLQPRDGYPSAPRDSGQQEPLAKPRPAGRSHCAAEQPSRRTRRSRDRPTSASPEGSVHEGPLWQLQPRSGAVLTVSVSNPQAGPARPPGGTRPFLRGRRPPAGTARPQPRGVPLRFNFRATANQTSLTLDERFSGLSYKRRFTAARNGSRTVLLP